MTRVSFLIRRIVAVVLPMASWAAAYAQEAGTDRLDHGNARVVLVGDSITGLSRNAGNGFAHQMDWALRQTFPDCKPNIIALGGSGQGVSSWSGVEKSSRTEERFLDVKGIPVKQSLDQHADVLVIMLGMNDVLAPYVLDEPESLQKWTDTYRELVRSLQARLTPKVTALATPTLCTEDVRSPKNQMMGKLIERVNALAKEMNLLVLPTNATMQEVLARGRKVKPDFHVTYDYIHPNEAGHLAIAMGMLRGLGVPEAARHLEEERLKPVLEKAAVVPPVTVEMIPLRMPLRNWTGFNDSMWGHGPPAGEGAFERREGWPFIQDNFTGAVEEGEFGDTRGHRRWKNFFATSEQVSKFAQRCTAPIVWHVAAGLMRPKAWQNNQIFDPALARGPVEEAIEQGRILNEPIDLGDGRKLEWHFYSATADFTGGDAQGSVNFDAVTHARMFEGGVAARRILSKSERAVHLELGTKALSPNLHLTVYLNGHSVYSGQITAEPKKQKTVSVVLRSGWNTLAFTLDHVAWQMQCSVEIDPVDGDGLQEFYFLTDERSWPSREWMY